MCEFSPLVHVCVCPCYSKLSLPKFLSNVFCLLKKAKKSRLQTVRTLYTGNSVKSLSSLQEAKKSHSACAKYGIVLKAQVTNPCYTELVVEANY